MKNWVLWLFAAIMFLCGLAAYLRLFSGTVLYSAKRTDGAMTAFVVEQSSNSALDVDGIAVDVRRKYSLVRHPVFFALNYGATVRVRWSGARELMISCESCANLAVYRCDPQWDDVPIHYAFSDGTPSFGQTNADARVACRK
jgi:hypothetical protein